MGTTKPHGTQQNRTGRELTAIKQLLEVDLNDVTRKQRDDAETTLRAHPGNYQMIGAVRQWARALAGVCRSHARDCAQVHASHNHQDPATSAMGTILLVLSDHLRLPADGALLFENWPAENAFRDFVLEVSGAPFDDVLARKPTLPRWEPKSSFARKVAGLEPYSDEQNTEFLSVDETQKQLSGLEELFRRALLEGLGTSFSEAVLARIHELAGITMIPKTGAKKQPGKGRPKSPNVSTRQQIIRAAAETGATGKRYCAELDSRKLSTPYDWQQRDHCPKRYLEAWDDPNPSKREKFRQRISNEKSKATKDAASLRRLDDRGIGFPASDRDFESRLNRRQ
jgi:hypothetical protein